MMSFNRKIFYAISVITFIVFNVIAFIVPINRNADFWVGYTFVCLTILWIVIALNVIIKDTDSLKSQPPQLILLLDTIHRPLIDNYFDSLFQFLMIKNSISLFRNKSAILSVVLTGGVLRSFLLLHDHFYVGYFSFIPLPITADRFLFYQHPDLLLPISSLPS